MLPNIFSHICIIRSYLLFRHTIRTKINIFSCDFSINIITKTRG
nr:MAG TPA: hypothetical protein [Caudoviricetes sp.]